MAESSVVLGHLETVALRDVWPTEDKDFTPWLAQEDNIKLLGDAIKIDLEVEAQEKSVGPYRADILCKDTATEHWVLIENQLEPTNHTHLGQLVTYAAGLNAVTIVWISSGFTGSHRAAMDWLNEITPDEFRFFGIEIELWRIGKSQVAPKFNIVSKPNDWNSRERFKPDMTPTRQLQMEYWAAFREVIEQRDGLIRPVAPKPQHWQDFSIGRTNFTLRAVISVRDEWIEIRLTLLGDNAKEHYGLLSEEMGQIECEASESFEWRELPENKESQINLRTTEYDPSDRDSWNQQHSWLFEKLNTFHKVFAPRIRNLSADDYIPQLP